MLYGIKMLGGWMSFQLHTSLALSGTIVCEMSQGFNKPPTMLLQVLSASSARMYSRNSIDRRRANDESFRFVTCHCFCAGWTRSLSDLNQYTEPINNKNSWDYTMVKTPCLQEKKSWFERNVSRNIPDNSSPQFSKTRTFFFIVSSLNSWAEFITIFILCSWFDVIIVLLVPVSTSYQNTITMQPKTSSWETEIDELSCQLTKIPIHQLTWLPWWMMIPRYKKGILFTISTYYQASKWILSWGSYGLWSSLDSWLSSKRIHLFMNLPFLPQNPQ